jgi:hypothetical protein
MVPMKTHVIECFHRMANREEMTEGNPTNSLKARAIDCIYLRFLSNTQGGHEKMNLSTVQIIRRRQVRMVPMKTHVIKCVHIMANREEMTEGLKIMFKTGVILHDNAWLP